MSGLSIYIVTNYRNGHVVVQFTRGGPVFPMETWPEEKARPTLLNYEAGSKHVGAISDSLREMFEYLGHEVTVEHKT